MAGDIAAAIRSVMRYCRQSRAHAAIRIQTFRDCDNLLRPARALFRCKIRCKRRHFSTCFDKSAQAENYRQANPLTRLNKFQQVLAGKGAGAFESRWGYQNRPYITRVSATLSGSAQQMCNSGALFVSSRRVGVMAVLWIVVHWFCRGRELHLRRPCVVDDRLETTNSPSANRRRCVFTGRQTIGCQERARSVKSDRSGTLLRQLRGGALCRPFGIVAQNLTATQDGVPDPLG